MGRFVKPAQFPPWGGEAPGKDILEHLILLRDLVRAW